MYKQINFYVNLFLRLLPRHCAISSDIRSNVGLYYLYFLQSLWFIFYKYIILYNENNSELFELNF